MVQLPPQKTSQFVGSRPVTGSVNNGVRPSQSSVSQNSIITKRETKTQNSDPQNVVYINDKIKAFEVIVITDDGENLGKMKRFDALALAQEQ